MDNKSIIDIILERNKNLFGISIEEILDEVSIHIPSKYKDISKYTLWIRNNEGSNMPHFHVNKGSEIMCYICLDIPIYFDHGDGVGNPLNSKECKELYEFMKSIHKENKTAYKTLCDNWSRTNSYFVFPDDVPDYTKLDPFITSKTINVNEYRKSGKIIYKKGK